MEVVQLLQSLGIYVGSFSFKDGEENFDLKNEYMDVSANAEDFDINEEDVNIDIANDKDVNISAIWINALEKSIMYNITHLPGLFSSLIMRYAFQAS